MLRILLIAAASVASLSLEAKAASMDQSQCPNQHQSFRIVPGGDISPSRSQDTGDRCLSLMVLDQVLELQRKPFAFCFEQTHTNYPKFGEDKTVWIHLVFGWSRGKISVREISTAASQSTDPARRQLQTCMKHQLEHVTTVAPTLRSVVFKGTLVFNPSR